MVYTLIIIINMFTWSQIPKDINNPETIEETIIRLISQHNNDSTSHMGEGQSIDIHRKNEIIDHKAGSVLTDKETMSELKYYTTFESLTQFDAYGDFSNSDQLGASIWCSNTSNDISGLSLYSNLQNYFLDDTKDLLFQTLVRYEYSNNNFDSWFGFLSGYTSSEKGIGFQIINGVLHTQVKAGTFTNNVSFPTIVLSNDNIFRVQYIAGERKVYFYVNNVLIHSVVIPNNQTFNTSASGGYEIKCSNSNTYYMRLTSLLISREI